MTTTMRVMVLAGVAGAVVAAGCGKPPVPQPTPLIGAPPASDAKPATAEAETPATKAKPPAAEAKPAAAGPKAESAANLKKFWMAACNYNDAYSRLPAPQKVLKSDATAVSWRVRILPFIEQDALYRLYRMNEPWDSDHNKTLIAKMPAIYAPVGGKAAPGETFYQVFVGPKTPFENGSAANLVMTPDGTTNTILVAEAATPVVWTKPDDIPFDPAGDAPKLGGMFGGEFRAVMMDGTLHTSKPGYDPAELKKAVTSSGSEINDFGKLWLAGPTPVGTPVTRTPVTTPAPAPPADPKSQAVANLRRIVLAVHSHFDMYKRLPTNVAGPDGKPLLSWRVAILPHLGEETLYKEFHLNEPWHSDHNKALVRRMPAAFTPPGGLPAEGETFYQAFVGPGAAFEPGKPLRLGDFKDGTANTILVVSAANPVMWTSPEDVMFDPAGPAPKLVVGLGFPCVMMSGDVREVKAGYDPAELKKAITRAGGEVIDDSKLWVGGVAPPVLRTPMTAIRPAPGSVPTAVRPAAFPGGPVPSRR